jgi:hypothetical protein
MFSMFLELLMFGREREGGVPAYKGRFWSRSDPTTVGRPFKAC